MSRFRRMTRVQKISLAGLLTPALTMGLLLGLNACKQQPTLPASNCTTVHAGRHTSTRCYDDAIRTAAQSWDQANLKAKDTVIEGHGCPTAIFAAPDGNLRQCD